MPDLGRVKIGQKEAGTRPDAQARQQPSAHLAVGNRTNGRPLWLCASGALIFQHTLSSASPPAKQKQANQPASQPVAFANSRAKLKPPSVLHRVVTAAAGADSVAQFAHTSHFHSHSHSHTLILIHTLSLSIRTSSHTRLHTF